MRLFKYRSLANFEFTADILCNQKFYAAQYFEMNDPMEGQFDYDMQVKAEYLNKIRYGKEDLRILSLTSDMSNLLMWAHYADSFRGICIELEIPESRLSNLEEINYSPFRVYVSDHRDDVAHLSRAILSGKNEAWEYEQEYRLFSSEKFVTDLQIKSVFLGMRISETMELAVRKLAGKIPVKKTILCPSTNSVIESEISSRKRKIK